MILRNLYPLEIQKYQANRYPWFFLDIVEEVMPGKYANGYKNFTYNEWFFPPHFEDNPIVPGFILTESLVQMFIMTFLTLENKGSISTNLISSNNKFIIEIKPGDRLDIKAKLDSYKRGLAKGSSIGYIKDKVAIKCEFMVSVPSIMNQFRPKI
ncbi:beta-hydroxyacyl-ACP dehydratase [Helicobacter sp. 16-1353]|nr:beta-hydroxyacyl-ACP dehydratase [Helicobacter sp. 16-1353]